MVYLDLKGQNRHPWQDHPPQKITRKVDSSEPCLLQYTLCAHCWNYAFEQNFPEKGNLQGFGCGEWSEGGGGHTRNKELLESEKIGPRRNVCGMETPQTSVRQSGWHPGSKLQSEPVKQQKSSDFWASTTVRGLQKTSFKNNYCYMGCKDWSDSHELDMQWFVMPGMVVNQIPSAFGIDWQNSRRASRSKTLSVTKILWFGKEGRLL